MVSLVLPPTCGVWRCDMFVRDLCSLLSMDYNTIGMRNIFVITV